MHTFNGFIGRFSEQRDTVQQVCENVRLYCTNHDHDETPGRHWQAGSRQQHAGAAQPPPRAVPLAPPRPRPAPPLCHRYSYNPAYVVRAGNPTSPDMEASAEAALDDGVGTLCLVSEAACRDKTPRQNMRLCAAPMNTEARRMMPHRTCGCGLSSLHHKHLVR